MTDASATAILTYANRIPATCNVPMPPLDQFRRASDKAALLPQAEAAGFCIPSSVVVESRAAVPRVRLHELTPGVLKPHRSVVKVGDELRRHGVLHYSTAEQGASALRILPDDAFPVLAQRRVEGPGVGFFALRWGGVVRASFAHRRLREVPPSGGVSVCRESIAPPPALFDAGNRLLAALDWQGVAMVECKHDPVTDRYYVMEINPRFWGSLQLAIDAGVDFPALLVECALGGSPVPIISYRVGLRSRWGWGELDYVYLRTKLRSPATAAVSAFLGALGELLHWSPGRDRVEILRWRDPLPSVVETLGRIGLLR
jgi:predicted ATP-grasp superfamily ATP-dependent carboligase